MEYFWGSVEYSKDDRDPAMGPSTWMKGRITVVSQNDNVVYDVEVNELHVPAEFISPQTSTCGFCVHISYQAPGWTMGYPFEVVNQNNDDGTLHLKMTSIGVHPFYLRHPLTEDKKKGNPYSYAPPGWY